METIAFRATFGGFRVQGFVAQYGESIELHLRRVL